MIKTWQRVWGHTVYKILERLGGRGYFMGQIWTDAEFIGNCFCAGNALTILIYKRYVNFFFLFWPIALFKIFHVCLMFVLFNSIWFWKYSLLATLRWSVSLFLYVLYLRNFSFDRCRRYCLYSLFFLLIDLSKLFVSQGFLKEFTALNTFDSFKRETRIK